MMDSEAGVGGYKQYYQLNFEQVEIELESLLI